MERDGPGEPDHRRIGTSASASTSRAVVGLEILGLMVMLLVTVGTLALVVFAHRRQHEPTVETAKAPVVDSAVPDPIERVDGGNHAPPAPEPTPEPPPESEPETPGPVEVDPTKAIVEKIAAKRDEIEEREEEARRRLIALRKEREEADARADRIVRLAREASTRSGLLDAEVQRLEAEAELLALERDVLDRRRVKAERERRRAIENPGYAVLPYRGPSGTWRRPIPVECRDGTATIQPGGIRFSMLELMPVRGPSGPFSVAVLKLAALLETEGAPDGRPVEPYVLFVVRPDGIRPFYEARSSLEAMDIPYGYELVEQDWEIEFPDWDDPTIWGQVEDAVASASDAQPVPLSGSIGGRPMQPGGWPDGAIAGQGRGVEAPFPPPPPTGNDLVGSLRDFDDLFGGRSDTPGPGERDGELDRLLGSGEGQPRSGDGPRGHGFPGSVEENQPGGIGSETGRWLDADEPGGASERPGGVGDGVGVGLSDRARGNPALPGRSLPDGSSSGLARAPSGAHGLGSGFRSTQGSTSNGDPGGIGPEGPGESIGEGPISLPSPFTGGGPGGGSDRTNESSASVPGGPAPADATGRELLPGSPGAGSGSDGNGSGGQGPSVSGAGSMADEGQGGGGGLGSGGGVPARIEEVVVACEPEGVIVHPGSYKLTRETLEDDPGRLVETLQAVISTQQRIAGPETTLIPHLRFLIEFRGQPTYWIARRQVDLSGLPWPVSWDVAGPQTFSIFGTERW